MIVKIGQIKPNPNNPRTIKDERFQKLVKSLQDFPEMLDKRPLIVFTDVDGKFIVLGGNQRLKAAKEAGMKELPVLLADDWTPEQQREFVVKDNLNFGEFDWDMLTTEWDTDTLIEWGLEMPDGEPLEAEPAYEDLIGENKNKPATMKITFTSPEQLQKAEIEIQELLDRNYQGAYFSVSAGEL